MCTLIYATVPSNADVARLAPYEVRLVPTEDAAVTPKLRPGEQLCGVGGVPRCGGGGHCGTVLGREAHEPRRSPAERDAAQGKKLRKQGWSEHKVQAWLAQKKESHSSQPPHMNGGVNELALWEGLIRSALEDAHLRFIGLMVFTAGQEPMLPLRSEDVSRTACDLTRLESGVLYRIHR
jgi:hypothetical protein